MVAPHFLHRILTIFPRTLSSAIVYLAAQAWHVIFIQPWMVARPAAGVRFRVEAVPVHPRRVRDCQTNRSRRAANLGAGRSAASRMASSASLLRWGTRGT